MKKQIQKANTVKKSNNIIHYHLSIIIYIIYLSLLFTT